MKIALAIFALLACVPFGLFLFWSYRAIEEFTAPTELPTEKQNRQNSGDGGGAALGDSGGDGGGGGGD